MSDTLPPVTPEDSAEFGVAHYFKGTRLEPFSFARQVAFQRMGVGSASPLESATMLVFLCLQAPARIDRARGNEGCAAFRREAAEWADANGIGVCYTDEAGRKRGSKPGHEVIAISDAIWSGIAAAESEPDLPGSELETAAGNV